MQQYPKLHIMIKTNHQSCLPNFNYAFQSIPKIGNQQFSFKRKWKVNLQNHIQIHPKLLSIINTKWRIPLTSFTIAQSFQTKKNNQHFHEKSRSAICIEIWIWFLFDSILGHWKPNMTPRPQYFQTPLTKFSIKINSLSI